MMKMNPILSRLNECGIDPNSWLLGILEEELLKGKIYVVLEETETQKGFYCLFDPRTKTKVSTLVRRRQKR